MERRSGQEPRALGLGGYYHHREVVRPEPRQPWGEKMEVETGYLRGLSNRTYQH